MSQPANQYGHDFDDPVSQLNMLETAWLAADRTALPPCPHCEVQRTLLPMTGTGWAVDTIHQDGCPTNDPPTPQRPGTEHP